MKHEEKQAMWSARMRDFRASGMTKRAWCEENRIKLDSLEYWRKKFSKEARRIGDSPKNGNESQSPQMFVLALAGQPDAQPNVTVKIGMATVEVRKGFDAELLADVLKAMASIC